MRSRCRCISASSSLRRCVAASLFAVGFGLPVVAQARSRTFGPARYWATIFATTTVGTTLADFAERSLGIGHAGGSAPLAALLMPQRAARRAPRAGHIESALSRS